MKLTALLLTVVFLQVHASSSAQAVTISGKDLYLTDVFAAIKQQTGYVVFYNRNMLADTRTVSLAVNNMPLQNVLDIVFRNQPVDYTIQDKTIILSRKTTPAGENLEAVHIMEGKPVVGTILDHDNQPLPGVSIRVKGSNRGVTAGLGGSFSLNMNEGDELVISAIGYETMTLRLVGDLLVVVQAPYKLNQIRQEPQSLLLDAHTFNVMVRLGRATSMLDEVQIVPYGLTSRRFSTGNIGTIKAKEIEQQPVMNVLQALEGKVPGLNLTSITGNSAAPMKVEIRGTSSINPYALTDPLYVIDGVPLNILEIGPLTRREYSTGMVQSGLTNTPGENPLLFMNPRDIESIDVLKDADATAIYGSRGANGVILITTKKNKPGPTRFSLSINYGRTSVPRLLPLMDTKEYLAMRREAFLNDRATPTIYNAQDLLLWDTTAYTNWQRELYGVGNQLTVDAKLTGGLVQTTYTIGANYGAQTELMNNSGKTQRSSFYISLGHTSINQKFRLNAVSRLSMTNVEAYNLNDPTGVPPNAPPIYLPNGEFNFIPWRSQFQNLFPFAGLKKPSKSRSHTVNNSLSMSYELMPGLRLSTTAGYNYGQNDNANYTPSAAQDPAYFSMSAVYLGNSSTSGWTVEPMVEYNTHFGKSSLSAQVGGSMQYTRSKGMTTLAQGFPNDELMNSVNNASATMNIDAFGEYKYVAFFGILNYRWNDKYILNLNARRDGSSRFGPGKQFGNFGSVGLAWIASEEKFIRDALPEWVSFLKFRGSYGITGGDGVGDYEYLSRWANSYTIGDIFGQKVFSYNGVQSFHIVRALNQQFQWQSSGKLDAGLHMGFLNDRVTLEAAYYRNRTGNQLTGITTPSYTGFESVTANWDALVQNSGLEAKIAATLVNTKNWEVGVNFNIARNWNKLVRYPGLANSPYASTYVVGKSLKTMYLLHYTGIDPLTGDYTFEDHNKDGVLYQENYAVPTVPYDDRYIEMDRSLRYSGGFGFNIRYKDLSLYSHFVYKNQLAQDPFIMVQLGQMTNGILPKEIAENHWRNPGDNARYPKYTINGNANMSYMLRSDGGFVDGSYLKMNTLSMSYNIPEKILQKIKMAGCTFSIQTQNLFTITSYKGVDPELQTLSMATPIPRTITSQLTFNF